MITTLLIPPQHVLPSLSIIGRLACGIPLLFSPFEVLDGTLDRGGLLKVEDQEGSTRFFRDTTDSFRSSRTGGVTSGATSGSGGSIVASSASGLAAATASF